MDPNQTNTPPPTPLPQQQPLPPVRRPMSLFKKIFIIVVGTVCLFGIWSTIFPDKTTDTATHKSATTTIAPKSSGPVQWKNYANKKYGYSVDYPNDLQISPKGSGSILFQTPQKAASPAAFPTLYISVIPAGATQSADIYNFWSPDMISSFSALKDGATIQTQTGTNAQYSTYQKLATIPVAGIQGTVIQNNKVWQGSVKLRERQILIQKSGMTYVIGGYFQTQQELDTLFHFLNNFKFIK